MIYGKICFVLTCCSDIETRYIWRPSHCPLVVPGSFSESHWILKNTHTHNVVRDALWWVDAGCKDHTLLPGALSVTLALTAELINDASRLQGLRTL